MDRSSQKRPNQNGEVPDLGRASVWTMLAMEAGGSQGPHRQRQQHSSRCYVYSHPALDRIGATSGMYSSSLKDHILSTSGWLYVHAYVYIPTCYRDAYVYVYVGVFPHACLLHSVTHVTSTCGRSSVELSLAVEMKIECFWVGVLVFSSGFRRLI